MSPYTHKVLAFYQELGELLQEMEWVFKDWKDRDLCRDDKEKQKKEWSDAWHFAISIGNSFGHSDAIKHIDGFLIQNQRKNDFNNYSSAAITSTFIPLMNMVVCSVA